MLERVIFAIDNDNDMHSNAKFMRRVDTLRALGKIEPVVLCIGNYEGVLERSYMMLAKDFHHVVDYIENQECVMYVPGDTRQPCTLRYKDGSVVEIGPMKRVDKSEAMLHKGWTYCEGNYYVCGSEKHPESLPSGD